MIYTVTFNPSIDCITRVPSFTEGTVNRAAESIIRPGGKGLNVSVVLKNLGFDPVSLGFAAGFTGEAIEKMMHDMNVKTDFIKLKSGLSRINFKLRSDKTETEVNMAGPVIGQEYVNALLAKLCRLSKGDILVLSGSIPASLPDDIYKRIMEETINQNVLTVVDASNELLKNVLHLKPFLIKPNLHELSEIFKVNIKSKEDAIFYAGKLRTMGAVNVLVSMAGDGAVLIDAAGKVHQSAAPEGKVISSVGAGDSMVAGFIAGFIETGDYSAAFKMGLAAGSASAFNKVLATRSLVDSLLKTI